MSRDKQISEMAKEICSEYDCVIPCQSCAYYGYENCRDVKSAEKLYVAGYRKASDVAEEIFELIDCAFSPVLVYNGYTVKEYLAELKRKYIGKDTNVTTNTEEGK